MLAQKRKRSEAEALGSAAVRNCDLRNGLRCASDSTLTCVDRAAGTRERGRRGRAPSRSHDPRSAA